MLRKIIYILILCFVFTSCLVTPPSSDSDKSTLKTYLRNIEVTCSEDTHCKNKSGENFEVVVIYTLDECKDIDVSSPVTAISRENLSCDEIECSALVKSFKKEGGVDDAVITLEGNYTVTAFIDINKNELPDRGEPFYCNGEVSISPQKRLVSLAIDIDRKLEI